MKKIFNSIFLMSILFLNCASQKLYKVVENSGKEIGYDISKVYNLHLLWFGSGSMIDTNIDTHVWNFLSEQKWKIEDAKPIAVYIADKIWKDYNDDPIFLEYIKERSQMYPDTIKPYLTPNSIGFKIAFWDANNNRPLHPYLAQIIYKEQKFYFYYADPKTEALQEPIIEHIDIVKQRLSQKI